MSSFPVLDLDGFFSWCRKVVCGLELDGVGLQCTMEKDQGGICFKELVYKIQSFSFLHEMCVFHKSNPSALLMLSLFSA